MRLVADILEAAIRVLERHGATGFTTTRVADAAGISVGSLYQYFPNKKAILFRLQADEWRQTMDRLAEVLDDSRMAPLERLRAAVRMYFRSECDEAAFRGALEDAAPLYREAPEARAHIQEGRELMQRFVANAIPNAPANERAHAADLIGTVMSAVGHAISSQGRPRAQVDRFAVAIGDMLCAYLLVRGNAALQHGG